jgi:fumarate reductase flavoprotein subunit
MLAPPRALTAGLDWKGRGPDVVLQTLGSRLTERSGSLLRVMRARRLLTQDGRASGVAAEQGGRSVEVTARAVLLADGGFQANPDLVRRFISPAPDRLSQRSAGSGFGDALMMAEEAGARITEAASFYGHLLSRDSLSNPGLWPYPTMDTLAGAAIMIDRSGRRFIDEGLGGIAHANALARLPDPLAATAVFDHPIWETAGRAELVPPNPQLLTAGSRIISAPDLATLAAKIDVPPHALVETVAAYNEALSVGAPKRLHPPRTAGRMFGESRSAAKRVDVAPVKEPPFYAVALAAGISYTMGGIAIDEAARVRSRESAPMPGLYAAGSCTGGVEGGPLAGYIGGYLKAVGLALMAADSINSMMRAGAA